MMNGCLMNALIEIRNKSIFVSRVPWNTTKMKVNMLKVLKSGDVLIILDKDERNFAILTKFGRMFVNKHDLTISIKKTK